MTSLQLYLQYFTTLFCKHVKLLLFLYRIVLFFCTYTYYHISLFNSTFICHILRLYLIASLCAIFLSYPLFYSIYNCYLFLVLLCNYSCCLLRPYSASLIATFFTTFHCNYMCHLFLHLLLFFFIYTCYLQ